MPSAQMQPIQGILKIRRIFFLALHGFKACFDVTF